MLGEQTRVRILATPSLRMTDIALCYEAPDNILSLEFESPGLRESEAGGLLSPHSKSCAFRG
jgi:hypothetical protein